MFVLPLNEVSLRLQGEQQIFVDSDKILIFKW
jgi:hypothetical protein